VRQVDVLMAVMRERKRQDDRFGYIESRESGQPSLAVLVEEVGEVAKAIVEQDSASMREELIQVAAVAVAMVEAIDLGRVPR